MASYNFTKAQLAFGFCKKYFLMYFFDFPKQIVRAKTFHVGIRDSQGESRKMFKGLWRRKNIFLAACK